MDLQVVDTRNTTYLVPALVRAGRRRGATWSAAVRGAADGIGEFRVIVDDRVVIRGRPESTDAALREVIAVIDETLP